MKPSASGLHGGVVKMGRVVWAQELKYLHAHVDSNTDGWSSLISTNKAEGFRATITDDTGAPSASIDLQIDFYKWEESFNVDTPEEVAQLKQLVRDWIAERKDDVAVIEDDDEADPPAGRGADFGCGMGAEMWGAEAQGLGVAMVAQVTAAVALGVQIWGATGVVVVKRPVTRRKLRPNWSCSRDGSDAESTGRASANNSDLDFIVSDGASPECLLSCV